MYNVSAYILYLSLVLAVVFFVGGHLYRNGRFYLEEIFHSVQIVTAVNRFLYAGYCLINAGGAFHCLYKPEQLKSWTDALHYIARHTGQLLLVLGILHFINLAILPLMKSLFQGAGNTINALPHHPSNEKPQK